MKKSLFITVLFVLFLSITSTFCSANKTSTNDTSIIKIMLLINDANKVLPESDPYAVMQIMKKLTIEIKYVDFKQVTDVQLKRITSFIIKKVSLKRKQTSKAVLPFVQAFTKNLEVDINSFFKKKASQKVLVSFANRMLKTLPGLKAINPVLILQLISSLRGITTKFA